MSKIEEIKRLARFNHNVVRVVGFFGVFLCLSVYVLGLNMNTEYKAKFSCAEVDLEDKSIYLKKPIKNASELARNKQIIYAIMIVGLILHLVFILVRVKWLGYIVTVVYSLAFSIEVTDTMLTFTEGRGASCIDFFFHISLISLGMTLGLVVHCVLFIISEDHFYEPIEQIQDDEPICIVSTIDNNKKKNESNNDTSIRKY